MVGMPLPQKFSETVKQLDASQHRYLDLYRQRRLVRRTYMELLLLLTVLVLFSTTWLALYPRQARDPPGGGAGGSNPGDFSRAPGLPR